MVKWIWKPFSRRLYWALWMLVSVTYCGLPPCFSFGPLLGCYSIKKSPLGRVDPLIQVFGILDGHRLTCGFIKILLHKMAAPKCEHVLWCSTDQAFGTTASILFPSYLVLNIPLQYTFKNNKKPSYNTPTLFRYCEEYDDIYLWL